MPDFDKCYKVNWRKRIQSDRSWYFKIDGQGSPAGEVPFIDEGHERMNYEVLGVSQKINF